MERTSRAVSRTEMIADGWEERFSVSGRRLDEVVSFYRSIGYEVRVVELGTGTGEGSCTTCFSESGVEGPVGLVFTRVGSARVLGEKDNNG